MKSTRPNPSLTRASDLGLQRSPSCIIPFGDRTTSNDIGATPHDAPHGTVFRQLFPGRSEKKKSGSSEFLGPWFMRFRLWDGGFGARVQELLAGCRVEGCQE